MNLFIVFAFGLAGGFGGCLLAVAFVDKIKETKTTKISQDYQRVHVEIEKFIKKYKNTRQE